METAVNLSAALEHARAARSAALAAVAVTSYFAASVELAEAHRVRAEHADAYGALATAWASLSDVIGGETAQSWVEPCLAAYRVAWGDAAFQQARSEYESALRRQLTEAAV